MTTAPPTDAPPPAPARRGWRARWRWIAGGVVILGVAAVLVVGGRRPATTPLSKADVNNAIATAIAKAGEEPPHSVVVYQRIRPSLVRIDTEGDPQSADSGGVGAGVIVRDDGTIVTARHVIEGARVVNVTFADGTKSKAQVVSKLPNDLAVLKADEGPELIVPAVLAGGLQVGDETFAVGHPLGLTNSLSSGVISGLGRIIPPRRGDGGLTDVIQFDAAVNPGNSGGPLLNREGQVVGIVTSLANASNERSFTGIGFAVPLGTAGGAGNIPK